MPRLLLSLGHAIAEIYGKRVRISTTCALSMSVSPYAMQYVWCIGLRYPISTQMPNGKEDPLKKPWRPVFVNHNKANTTVPATQMSNDIYLL